MPVEIHVTGNEDGTVSVAANTNQKVICWGLLIAAMFAIHNQPVDTPKIIPGMVLPPEILGRGGKG